MSNKLRRCKRRYKREVNVCLWRFRKVKPVICQIIVASNNFYSQIACERWESDVICRRSILNRWIFIFQDATECWLCSHVDIFNNFRHGVDRSWTRQQEQCCKKRQTHQHFAEDNRLKLIFLQQKLVSCESAIRVMGNALYRTVSYAIR